MMRRTPLVLLGAIGFAFAVAVTSMAVRHDESTVSSATGGPRAGAAVTPTVAIDDAGRLWAAWVEQDTVRVARAEDDGRRFGASVAVTREPELVDANGESRPSLIVAGDDVYVAWTRKGAAPYSGDIRFAVSRDGGRTFPPPVTVNDDGLATGHRFQAMARLADGRLLLAWIDKRDVERARRAGREDQGAALYASVSGDGGRTFTANRKLQDHVCECCRLAVSVAPNGSVAILFRNIFPEHVRDHAVVRLSPSLEPLGVERVTRDGWQIQACPHHGPALAIGADGTWHMAWFTGAGPSGPGQFYARSTDGGHTFSPARRLGTEDSLGHPDLLVQDGAVRVAWKDRNAAGALVIRLAQSPDGGLSWAAPRDVLRGEGSTDHPQLLAANGRVLLAWFTSEEGLRVLPVPGS